MSVAQEVKSVVLEVLGKFRSSPELEGVNDNVKELALGAYEEWNLYSSASLGTLAEALQDIHNRMLVRLGSTPVSCPDDPEVLLGIYHFNEGDCDFMISPRETLGNLQEWKIVSASRWWVYTYRHQAENVAYGLLEYPHYILEDLEG